MWKEMFLDIIYGYKKIFVWLGIAVLALACVWGVISGVLTIAGAMDFQWWNTPCWLLAVSGIAGCFGQDR